MILEFSVKNFRSIKDLQTISFATTGLKSAEKHQNVDINNIAIEGDIALFKTIGLYGANASGKSNILKALDYFIKVITKDASSNSHLKSLCDPFLFSEEIEDSFFQIVLLINGEKYRYGFTVKKKPAQKNNLDPKEKGEIITNEWLYGVKESNMSSLFIREAMDVSNKNLKNNKKIPSLQYNHSLYLTHAAAFDRKGICQTIKSHLSRLVASSLHSNEEDFRWLSIDYLDDVESKKMFVNFLSAFDIKYDNAFVDKDEDYDFKNVLPQEKISFSKIFLNKKIALNLFSNESSGTQKLFDLSGLLLRAFNLKQPAFIIIDEIDSNFHPSLLIKFIQLFNNPEINRSNSQLLFTSHDTNLMSPSIMRRDQFYFAEKTEEHSTRIYSLADLKGIRNDANFAKQYLSGFYGAIPKFEDLMQEES